MSMRTSIRMSIRAAALAAMLCVTRASQAQTAAEHLALGDREHAAMQAPAALAHYEQAIAADSK